MINITYFYESFPGIFYGFAFFFGAITASFGGVIASRLPIQYGWNENDSGFETFNIAYPDSHCDSCKTKLSFIALIPIIGWFINSGKCENCGVKVPFFYPLSELILGILFVKSLLIWGIKIDTFFFMLACWISYVISVIDWETTWIPEMFTTPMMWVGLLLPIFSVDVYSGIYGGAIAWLLFSTTFWLISRLKNIEAYSGGDVAFATMVGTWIGFERIFEYLFLSCVVFIIMAASQRRNGELWTPMGPALAITFVAEMIFIGYNFHLFPKIYF